MNHLSDLLKSSDPDDRKKAILSISKTFSQEFLPMLRHLAEHDPHVDVRFLAKRVIHQKESLKADSAAGGQGQRKYDETGLKTALESGPQEKIDAIRHIVERKLKGFLPLLADYAKTESDPTVLSALIIGIGRLGGAGDFGAIVSFFAHPNSRVRANTLEAAGHLGSPLAFPFMLKLLEDPDNRVRGNAALFIRNLGPANTLKTIKAMAESPLIGMKASAAFVLQFFPGEDVMGILETLLACPDECVRSNTLKTLEVLEGNGSKKAGELLSHALKRPDVPEYSISPRPLVVEKAPPHLFPGAVTPPLTVKDHSHFPSGDQLPEITIGTAGKGLLADHLKPFAQKSPLIPSSESGLDQILVWARTAQVSDIHLSPGKPLMYRQYGMFRTMQTAPFTAKKIQVLAEKSGLDAGLIDRFHRHGDLETVLAIGGSGRYRITMMKHFGGVNITARVIPRTIRPFEETGMPPSCRGLTKWAQGLVLVTGPAGSGKTSTLSTLVEMINQTRHDHIVTIENPVEIVYEPAGCQVSQREVGSHTLTQKQALRAALREDPDIIVVSELRDFESIQIAISAAETGHLVLGTMNTINAARTVSRITDSFPHDEQPMLQSLLSESLRGIICQQLIPRKDGAGVVPAYEVLIVTPAVSNMIRKEGIHQLASVMTLGKSSGMVTMDQSLRQLAETGFITWEEAYSRAEGKREFEHFLPGKPR